MLITSTYVRLRGDRRRLLRIFDLVTGERFNSNKPSFSLEDPDEIHEAIIDSLCLERFIPN